MSNINSLKYPKKSHRKAVILPKESIELAEFFGIMMGDGGINNNWQATITVNAVADALYAPYICNLCKKLFGVEPTVRKRKTTKALAISLASVSIVDFLVSKGLSRGNKLKNGLKIPKWVMRSGLYKKACVRGLVDTDECLYVHVHTIKGKVYKNIGFSFVSHSRDLLFEVAAILEEFGLIAHISKRCEDLSLYQALAVANYLKVFGTSNPRIEFVYKKWRDARVV